MAIMNPLILELFLRKRGLGGRGKTPDCNCQILDKKRPNWIKKGYRKKNWSYDGLPIELNIGLIWKKGIVFKLDLAR